MKSKTILLKQSQKKEEYINLLSKLGFNVIKDENQIVTFKKKGTNWTFKGEDMPLKLTIDFQDKNIQLTLKYNTLVLFDTGDLQKILDEISNTLTKN